MRRGDRPAGRMLAPRHRTCSGSSSGCLTPSPRLCDPMKAVDVLVQEDSRRLLVEDVLDVFLQGHPPTVCLSSKCRNCRWWYLSRQPLLSRVHLPDHLQLASGEPSDVTAEHYRRVELDDPLLRGCKVSLP